MEPIVVAHLIATNFFGGPEKQIVAHAQLLDKSRFRFVLISFVENGQQNELLHHAREAGIEVVELHTGHAFDLRVVMKLKQVLWERNIHLLCSHGYKANVIGRLATGIVGIPHVAVSRGWTAENRKIRLYERMDKFFLRFADRIVAVSNGQREKILRLGIKPEQVTVIRNAIDLSDIAASGETDSIRRELGIPENAVLVASAGRLSPEKNHDAMIRAALIACVKRTDLYFLVFGEGFLRYDLETKIREAGLGGRFLLPGFTKDIQRVFKSIDIFMLPSFTEGLPNVALEAFAARKPIVASNVGGTPEVVQDGVSGFLTTPDNVEAMADFILKLADDCTLRERFGLAGYYYISENFSFQKQTIKYEEFYNSFFG